MESVRTIIRSSEYKSVRVMGVETKGKTSVEYVREIILNGQIVRE